MEFIKLVLIGVIFYGIFILFKKEIENIKNSNDPANTWKTRTIVYGILTLVALPSIIFAIIFAILAHKSYKNGKLELIDANSDLVRLEKLKDLLESDAISKEEFKVEKSKILNKT
ncbi:hypothetical protein [uncultured Gammaproteobacteria bacterium]|uniref:SHOCT domain-containing protein n=1 Tax=Bathymodiolus heckerae thiotrophic gill symbiont TaxID=1052212 RepID=UPI0010B20E0F|nr:SHOCT domain-containing protein [Bathymodiolus heckerae thiotrophic gill symbiont]CAC9586611.1 hypothetical protein [uncultured Gammaproteobacteria bacterium]SHN89573.1 hypothetical protein BHECKSOX_2026 [Bathymodiolus heckerae thiotrophic gill symbiont]